MPGAQGVLRSWGAEFVQGDAGGLHTQFAGLSEEILGSLHS